MAARAEATSSLYLLAQRVNILGRPGVSGAEVGSFVKDAAKALGRIARMDKSDCAHLASILQFSTRYAQPEEFSPLVERSLPALKRSIACADDTVLASILNSVSKADRIPSWFGELAAEAVDGSGMIETGRVMPTVTAVRALTRLGYDDEEGRLYPRLKELLRRRALDLKPEELALALHAFAGNRRHRLDKELLERMGESIIRCGEEVKGTTAASLMYSFTMAKCNDRRVVDMLGQAVVKGSDNMKVDGITLALTALAGARDVCDVKSLFMAIAEPLTHRLEELRPMNISAVVQAAARVRFYDYRILSSLTHCALDLIGLGSFSTVELAMLIQGLAKLKFGSSTLHIALFSTWIDRTLGAEGDAVAVAMVMDAARRRFNSLQRQKGPSRHVSSRKSGMSPLHATLVSLSAGCGRWVQGVDLGLIGTRELTQIATCLVTIGEVQEEGGSVAVEWPLGSATLGELHQTALYSLFTELAKRGDEVKDDGRRFIADAWRMYLTSARDESVEGFEKETRERLMRLERRYPETGKSPFKDNRVVRRSVARREFDLVAGGGEKTNGRPAENRTLIEGLFHI